MVRKTSLFLIAAALVYATAANAQVQRPGWFGSLDGFYAARDHGGAINSNNVGSATPGDGGGFSGRIGYRFMSPWDLALGISYARLGDGRHIGFQPANEWSVTSAEMLNVDGEAGYNLAYPWGGLRPFFGFRYQRMRHEMGYHPDVPLGCCGNETTANAFGPRVGFDATVRLSGPFSLIGGANFALLFGDLKERGIAGTVAHGSDNRTITNFGAHIGLDYEFQPLWHLAGGYRADVSNGSFFTDEGFTASGAPSGRASRTIHGPFVGVRYNFGGVPR